MKLLPLFIFLISLTTAAKEPRQYLYSLYTEVDIVARVVVLNQRDLTNGQAEYELKILKPIKGVSNEKEIKVVSPHYKDMPRELPHLSDGDVGMIFIQKEKSTNGLRVHRFLHANDFTVSTSQYLCKSPGEICEFTTFSEVENFFKTR